MTEPEQQQEGPRSSVKLDVNAKGAVQPKISVYEGTSEDEMQRIKDIAIRTLEVTLNELPREEHPGGGMSNEVDYYDVQNMIRDARSEIRGEIDRAVREVRQKLWADVKLEVQEASLSASVAELDERVRMLGEVTAELRREIEAWGRVINSRTEHLA